MTQNANNDRLLKQRQRLDALDQQILQFLAERQTCSQKIAELKKELNRPIRDKSRESQLLDTLTTKAKELRLNPSYINQLYCQIIHQSVYIQQNELLPLRLKKNRPMAHDVEKTLKSKPYRQVSRLQQMEDTLIAVGDSKIGGNERTIIAGACSVESKEQIFAIAEEVKREGAHILRGGCYKPRTSPYSFQGLGIEGLKLLREAGDWAGLPIVTEVMATEDIATVAKFADILQVGARNMQNYSLLKELGTLDQPILLKRGFMATIDEWLSSAEYILTHGNHQVILCERGIRTFETATRNTLDLSAVLVAQERSHLPVIVDPSHACGSWRYVNTLAKASLAAGAHGIMVEIHPEPSLALSDGPQALNFQRFAEMMGELTPFLFASEEQSQRSYNSLSQQEYYH